MKTHPFFTRLLAASAALSPLLAATAALAAAPTTYSSTQQSVLVQQAISALRAGNSAGFAALLDDQAQTHYKSIAAAQRLRARIEARASGAATLNFKAEVNGRIQPDTHLGMVSHRVYSIEVLGTPQGPAQVQEPFGKFTVSCMGMSFLDSFGGTQSQCRITEVSSSGASAYADGSESRNQPEARSLAGDQSKMLGEEALAPLAAPAHAGGASVQKL